MANRGGRSVVQGPTSALTSFLRERGIRPPTQNRFQRIPVEEQLNPPSQQVQEAEVASIEPEENPPNRLHVPNNVASSSSRFPAANASKKASKKKRKNEDSDPEERDAGRKPRNLKTKARRDQDQDVLSELVRICSQCNRRYIFDEQEQVNCNACLNVGVIGSKRSGSTAAQKRALKKAEKTVLEMTGEMMGHILPLKELCIQAIVKHVEMIGSEEIPLLAPETKQKISRIMSRQRKITPASLPLFLGPFEDVLELFDCSYLPEETLNLIPSECPHLVNLHLGMCGRATDTTINQIGLLKNLSSLTLQGTFLCTSGAFAGLFQQLPNLRSLTLENATKLTNDALQYLVENCPLLRKLSLTDCPLIDEEGLVHVRGLQHVQSICLNSIGQVSDSHIALLVDATGKNLTELSLNKQEELGELTLKALESSCQSLQSLSLQHCPKIETAPLSDCLAALSPLTALDLTGNNNLENHVLEIVEKIHSSQLESLTLNGVDLLDSFSLFVNASLPRLKMVDVSWNRGITDEVLLPLLTKAGKLERVRVFGCSLLSRALLERHWRNENGKRIVILGNEFD